MTVSGTARETHPVVWDEVYRIGYEAIRNAYTHSRATQLEVALGYGRDLTPRPAALDTGSLSAALEGMLKLVHFSNAVQDDRSVADVPLNFPDKRAALLGALCARFALGFFAAVTTLPLSPVLAGIVVGILTSLPDAIITKAYVPIRLALWTQPGIAPCIVALGEN